MKEAGEIIRFLSGHCSYWKYGTNFMLINDKFKIFQSRVHRGDSENAEGDCLMENREIAILHKPQAFGQQVPHKGLKAFCLFRLPRNKQKMIFSASSAALR